jgi:hypothetical protein
VTDVAWGFGSAKSQHKPGEVERDANEATGIFRFRTSLEQMPRSGGAEIRLPRWREATKRSCPATPYDGNRQ